MKTSRYQADALSVLRFSLSPDKSCVTGLPVCDFLLSGGTGCTEKAAASIANAAAPVTDQNTAKGTHRMDHRKTVYSPVNQS